MRITLHPEHESVYLTTAAANRKCRAAVAAWQAEQRAIPAPEYDVTWTVDSARRFVEALSALFGAYNRVLWEHFHYCPSCGGQCCVVDASDVRPFDLIAVALLEQQAPDLGAQVETTGHGCIYLSGHHCTWPDAWRTIKCWSFYCLGSGPWDASSSLHELYATVTRALQEVVETHLPAALRRYEQVHDISLAATLDDPVLFANTLHEALTALFVAPLHAHYPLFSMQQRARRPHAPTQTASTLIPLLNADVMEFISEAMSTLVEQVEEEGANAIHGIAPEEFLADLETLEWILMGKPAQSRALLREMAERYGETLGPESVRQRTLAGRMGHHLRYLLRTEFAEPTG